MDGSVAFGYDGHLDGGDAQEGDGNGDGNPAGLALEPGRLCGGSVTGWFHARPAENWV